jgi:hypothetical protein
MHKVITKKYWVGGQVTKAVVMPVGDGEGHLLGMFESRGLAKIENEVAVATSWAHGDLVKGSGPMRGYTRYVYEDGSTVISKTQYTCTSGPESKTGLYEDGYGEFITGTGRFAGIKGSSSWKGRQVTPMSKETKGDWIVEGTMSYTLPSK